MKKQEKRKNKGYELEKIGEKNNLWKRLNNRPYWKEGDVVDENNDHIQVKTQYGQISCSDWKDLEKRLNEEYSNKFAVGIEKRGKIEIFFFTKESFINLLMNNKELVKRELKSDGKTYHFRLQFTLSKGKINKIMKASYRKEKVEHE